MDVQLIGFGVGLKMGSDKYRFTTGSPETEEHYKLIMVDDRFSILKNGSYYSHTIFNEELNYFFIPVGDLLQFGSLFYTPVQYAIKWVPTINELEWKVGKNSGFILISDKDIGYEMALINDRYTIHTTIDELVLDKIIRMFAKMSGQPLTKKKYDKVLDLLGIREKIDKRDYVYLYKLMILNNPLQRIVFSDTSR